MPERPVIGMHRLQIRWEPSACAVRAAIATAVALASLIALMLAASASAHPRRHSRQFSQLHRRAAPRRAARHGTRASKVSTQSAPVAQATPSRRAAPEAALTACPEATLAPTPADIEALREATLCLINRERIAHSEHPLRISAKLRSCAQSHSESMAEYDFFSHEEPNGSTPLSRMEAIGYIYSAQIGYEIGENIAWGTLWLSLPKAIVESWMQSPEHRANILDPNYTETGIGIFPRAPESRAESQPGAVYTQDFGVIVPA